MILKKIVRFEILLPLAMVLLQIGWSHIVGTEDLFIEDCMKLNNEPKRVTEIYHIPI